MKSLPQLPANAQYYYANETGCELGLGMAAKVMNSGLVKKEDYRHYFFMSSAFRGPFIPTYALVSCPCHTPELIICHLACNQQPAETRRVTASSQLTGHGGRSARFGCKILPCVRRMTSTGRATSLTS